MQNIYSQDSFIARPETYTTNSLLALKAYLTDSCGGGSPSRLATNDSRSFRSLVINES